MKFRRLPACVCLFIFPALCCAPLHAQEHDMRGMQMSMPVSRTATLAVKDDPAAQVLTAKLGPLNLPANTSHMRTAQPRPQFLKIPFDGWIIAYHPRLVEGTARVISGHLLTHLAFTNAARPGLVCPNRQEHIFGAGGELNDWPATPAFGYRGRPGDRVRITSRFHTPTAVTYPAAY